MFSRTVVIAVMFLAVVALLRPSVDTPAARVQTAPATPAAAPPPAAPAIRLQHEFIEVRPKVRSKSSRPPHVRAAAIRAKAPETSALITRARRAVMGDGRYRPEPFPRIASR